jgi:hypothetical protein
VNTTADRQWIEEFVVELRLRDVPGDAIGDAVATVREFLGDSGQSAIEAFGTPRAYAASLDLPGRARSRLHLPTVARSLAGLLAFLVFTMAATSWLNGEQRFEISWRRLLMFGVVCALVVTLPRYLNVLLRHRWAMAAVVLAGLATGVFLSQAPSNGTVGSFVAMPSLFVVIVAGVVLVALSVVQSIAVLRGVGVDPVREPGSVRPPRGAVSAPLGIAWMFPVAAALFVVTALLLSR